MPLQNALPSIIKSVQVITANTGATYNAVIAIAAVNILKTVVTLNGTNSSSSVQAALTSATSVTIQSSAPSANVCFTVTEYA